MVDLYEMDTDHEVDPKASKKQHALTALQRAVDALKRGEIEKAQKLVLVSQQLRETRAAIAVALCIELTRISCSPSACREAVHAAEDALAKESLDDLDLEVDVPLRGFSGLKESFDDGNKATSEGMRGRMSASSSVEDYDDDDRDMDGEVEVGGRRAVCEPGSTGSTCSEASARRSRAQARRQNRLAEERAELRRKEAARVAEAAEAELRRCRKHQQDPPPRRPIPLEPFRVPMEMERKPEPFQAARKRSEPLKPDPDTGKRKVDGGYTSPTPPKRERYEVERERGSAEVSCSTPSASSTVDASAERSRGCSTSGSSPPPAPATASKVPPWRGREGVTTSAQAQAHETSTAYSEEAVRLAGVKAANREAATSFLGLAVEAVGAGQWDKARRMLLKVSALAPGVHADKVAFLQSCVEKEIARNGGPGADPSPKSPSHNGHPAQRAAATTPSAPKPASSSPTAAAATGGKPEAPKPKPYTSQPFRFKFPEPIRKARPAEPSAARSPPKARPPASGPASLSSDAKRSVVDDESRSSSSANLKSTSSTASGTENKATGNTAASSDTKRTSTPNVGAGGGGNEKSGSNDPPSGTSANNRNYSNNNTNNNTSKKVHKEDDTPSRAKTRPQDSWSPPQEKPSPPPANREKPKPRRSEEEPAKGGTHGAGVAAEEDEEGQEAREEQAQETEFILLDDIPLMQLVERLLFTINQMFFLFRLIVMKLGLVVMHQCVSMLGVLSSKRRCFAYAVALMGLGAMGWAGWLTEPLQLGWEWAVYACNAMATVVGNVWYTVVWEPAIWVWPATLTLSYIKLPRVGTLPAVWVYCCCFWLMGGGWCAIAGALGVFHERSSKSSGMYSLAASGVWFGLSWAWESWWGVLFIVVALLAYLFLIVVIQASQQDNGSKGQGIGPLPIPSGAPQEVARVLGAPDYYEVLELPRDCTSEDVRRMGKRKKLQTHPDKTGGAPGSNDAVQRVQQAESALKDPTNRARYDRVLASAERGESVDGEDAGGNSGSGGGKSANNAHERSKGQPRNKGHKTNRKPKAR